MIERELQAGRDTAEWAYDRADVRAAIKHSRPRIAESSDAGGFQAHSYLARLAFDRAEIVRVEFNYLRPDASLTVIRASLYDATTGASVPLDSSNLPPERWRRLQSFGHVNVYENLKAMPRAWFARRTVAAPGAEVLRAIKEGKLSDGAVFDPSEVALLETEDLTGARRRCQERARRRSKSHDTNPIGSNCRPATNKPVSSRSARFSIRAGKRAWMAEDAGLSDKLHFARDRNSAGQPSHRIRLSPGVFPQRRHLFRFGTRVAVDWVGDEL